MTSVRRTLGVVLLIGLGALPLSAQQPAAPSLTDLQSKQSALDGGELNTLRSWVDERIAAICGDDLVAASQALVALRTEFKGTDTFKEAYADVLTAAVAQTYGGAKLVPAVRLITALHWLNDADTRVVLLEALKDERVALRTAAAIGLRKLRVKLALAGGQVFVDTLNALRDAGKRETATVALKTIYQAMNYPAAVPAPPDTKVNVNTVLDLLEARARQYAAGNVRALGADATGLKLGGALLRYMDDAEKKRLTIAAATMLKYAVTSYTGGTRPLYKITKDDSRQIQATRDQTELLIVAAEELLIQLWSPKLKAEDTIATAMKRAADPIDMKIAMNKWGDILKPAVGVEFYMDVPLEPPSDGGG